MDLITRMLVLIQDGINSYCWGINTYWFYRKNIFCSNKSKISVDVNKINDHKMYWKHIQIYKCVHI